jgi:hypothetical protein
MICSVCYGYRFACAPKIVVGVCAADPNRVYAVGRLRRSPGESCTRTASRYLLMGRCRSSQRRASDVHAKPEAV